MNSITAPAPFRLEELTEPTLPTWASKTLRAKHAEVKASIVTALKSRAEFVQRFEALNAGDLLSANFPSPEERSRARVRQLQDELASRELIVSYHEDIEAESLPEDARRSEVLKAARREAVAKLTAAGFDEFDPKTRPQCLEDWVVNQHRGVKNAWGDQQALADEMRWVRSSAGGNGNALMAVREQLQKIRSNALREAALV